MRAAAFIKAKVIGIPLTKDHSHDVRAMVKADPNAGIIYICNPNNPTGTVTSRADIEWALANKPAGSILLLDEAYIHLSKAWESRGSDLVAAGKEVVVLRTFSKLYGMAGLRAGYAMGRPEYLEKIANLGAGAMAITAMAGASASVKVKTLVPDRRKQIVALAARHAVPAIYQFREFPQTGGLASYGIRLTDVYHQSGVYVGRILKGAAPGELPFVRIDRFELVINLRTAKALGLALSNSMQLLADELIE